MRTGWWCGPAVESLKQFVHKSRPGRRFQNRRFDVVPPRWMRARWYDLSIPDTQMRNLVLIAAVFAAAGCAPVLAQTACPQGVAVGSARCGPGGGGITADFFYKKSPTWRSGWGALARNDAQSIIGASTGTRSPKAAGRGAVRGCRSGGGQGCEVFFTYRDSCVVIVKLSGTEAVMPTYHMAAPSVEEASSRVLETCSRANEGRACEVIYSNCSSGFYRN